MEKSLKEIMESLPQPMTLPEVLESYSHIELTNEEMIEAVIFAKRQKERRLHDEEVKKRQEENRKHLTGHGWTYQQTRDFMLYRAANLFGRFNIDDLNRPVFDLLCYYFSNDKMFVSVAKDMQIENPSLDKGILLYGGFGSGKTWLMKLFAKNQRQVFHVHNAKEIADDFQTGGVEAVEFWTKQHKAAFEDPDVFYQKILGVCIDDIGAEDEKKHYGNNRNVIGDMIELCYSNGNVGPLLHVTTNLNAEQIKDYYGGRVASRMKEIFNLIVLPGADRRK
jgi:hypothetical protein